MLQKQRSTSELFATIGLIVIKTIDMKLEDFGQLDDFGQQGYSDTLRILEYSHDTRMIDTQVGVFHLTL